MEPESQKLACELGGPQFAAAPVTIAAVSIAISLKRIADALTYQPGTSKNIHDFLSDLSSAAESLERNR